MSILTDLRAALGAKREIDTALFKSGAQYGSQPEYLNLHALLTADTIRAFLDVAEAVEAIYFDDDDDWHRMWIRVPEAKAALAPLVKEATDE